MLQMVLARIRQLSAHETGHTLGLAHNFAASTVTQGDSVMDYPHPYITLDGNGHVDVSHAYATGIGDWDKVAINYGYREFGPRTTCRRAKRLRSTRFSTTPIMRDRFSSPTKMHDRSARRIRAHICGTTATIPPTELDRVLAVRATALKNFGENSIKPGTPMAQLEQTLVPLYLFHRYQTEAAIKEIGGLDYRYNLRGDGLADPSVFDPAQQRKALDAV